MLKPLPLNRWNRATAAHLLNRAGFGGPPGAVAALASRSPAEAVAALMAQKESGQTPDLPWAKPDPHRAEIAARIRSAAGVERQALVAEQRRKALAETSEMQEWWLGRMASGPDFFREKLTLFWHGHFATSIRKVREPYLMWRQNDLFRRLGTGSWRELLQAVVRDPAMLVWLDQAQSRKEHPNENFARELMELFTLGEGRYSERDVAEAARALTGESLDRETDAHVYRTSFHDGGTKTVLGVSGHLKSDDIIDAILAKPEADRFIAGKLWTFFAGAAPGEKLGDALAAEFRACGQRFQPFLRAVFESAEFYEPEVVGRQIKSPVQWLITACLQLERPLPPAPVPSFMLRTLGQELFAPPNVKGWDGGAAWINTNTLLARHNLALLLVEGETAFTAAGNRLGIGAAAQLWHDRPLTPPADPKPWFAEADRVGRNRVISAIEHRFFSQPISARPREALLAAIPNNSHLDNVQLRAAVRLALCAPEYQLA